MWAFVHRKSGGLGPRGRWVSVLFVTCAIQLVMAGVAFVPLGKWLHKRAGAGVLHEPDSVFAAVTLLLGVFIPTAMGKHRDLMAAYHRLAQSKKTITEYIERAAGDAGKFEADFGTWFRGLHRYTFFGPKNNPDSDLPAIMNLTGDLADASSDYIHHAVVELREAAYQLQSTRLFEIRAIYPNALYAGLLIYFGILMPVYNSEAMGHWVLFDVGILGLFANTLFLLGARDIVEPVRGSPEYEHLKLLQTTASTAVGVTS